MADLPPLPPDLVPAVAAMDVLNRYARASHAIVSSFVLYLLKDQAIRVLSDMGRARHRRIVVVRPCPNCGGDGWHRRPGRREWGWDEVGERCNTCAGTRGKKHLHFVETTLPDLVWHSPASHGIGCQIWNALEFRNEDLDPRGWTPRQPGTALSTAEAVRALLAVEAWLLPTWLLPPEPVRTYTLDLGCVDPYGKPSPFHCRAHGDLVGPYDHLPMGRVRWLGRACKASGCAYVTVHPDACNPDVTAWSALHPPADCDTLQSPVDHRVVDAAHDDIPF